MAIGGTIRRLRRERGLSLRDLGRATGFSISFLSLVERGRSSISLTSLHTVAIALEVEMSVFFPSPDAQPEPANAAHVSRRSGDARLQIHGAHTYRLLGATGFDRALEPLLVTIAAGEEADSRDDYAHEGEEFAYVLSGELVFTVDGAEHRLEAGDCIHYQSTVTQYFTDVAHDSFKASNVYASDTQYYDVTNSVKRFVSYAVQYRTAIVDTSPRQPSFV